MCTDIAPDMRLHPDNFCGLTCYTRSRIKCRVNAYFKDLPLGGCLPDSVCWSAIRYSETTPAPYNRIIYFNHFKPIYYENQIFLATLLVAISSIVAFSSCNDDKEETDYYF